MDFFTKEKYAYDLKLALIVLLFFLSIFHFLVVTAFAYQAHGGILWDKLALGIPLVFAIGFLWSEEFRSRKVLKQTRDRFITMQERIKRSNLETIKSLVLAEEAKDPYTKGHSTRVTEYACLVAKRLGYSDEELRILQTAGELHDLGKMGLADIILHKEGKLDKYEWEIVKRHPNLAIEILNPLKFLSAEKKIIKHHHERWDGKGYPDGLYEEHIPLGSRILAVADSFDAMMTKRPYRKPLEKHVVLSELKNNAGVQFDPKITNVFLQILNEHTI